MAGERRRHWPLPGAHTHTHGGTVATHGSLGALPHSIFLLQSFSKLQKTHLAVDRHAHRRPPLASAVLESVTDWPAEVSLTGHELCPSHRAVHGANIHTRTFKNPGKKEEMRCISSSLN